MSKELDGRDLDKFDAFSEKVDAVIQSAIDGADPDRINRAQNLANEFIDGYTDAIVQAGRTMARPDWAIADSKAKLSRLQDALGKLVRADRGRMEIPVVHHKGLPDDLLPMNMRFGFESDSDKDEAHWKHVKVPKIKSDQKQ